MCFGVPTSQHKPKESRTSSSRCSEEDPRPDGLELPPAGVHTDTSRSGLLSWFCPNASNLCMSAEWSGRCCC